MLFHDDCTAENLLECLVNLPPADLKGLALIERPYLLADRAVVRDAVLELIAYNGRCTGAVWRLRDVPPVPLIAFVPVDWAL